jgi:hypothetical protein
MSIAEPEVTMRDSVRCIKLLPPLLLSLLFTWSHIATEYPAATSLLT